MQLQQHHQQQQQYSSPQQSLYQQHSQQHYHRSCSSSNSVALCPSTSFSSGSSNGSIHYPLPRQSIARYPQHGTSTNVSRATSTSTPPPNAPLLLTPQYVMRPSSYSGGSAVMYHPAYHYQHHGHYNAPSYHYPHSYTTASLPTPSQSVNQISIHDCSNESNNSRSTSNAPLTCSQSKESIPTLLICDLSSTVHPKDDGSNHDDGSVSIRAQSDEPDQQDNGHGDNEQSHSSPTCVENNNNDTKVEVETNDTSFPKACTPITNGEQSKTVQFIVDSDEVLKCSPRPVSAVVHITNKQEIESRIVSVSSESEECGECKSCPGTTLCCLSDVVTQTTDAKHSDHRSLGRE